MATPRKSRSKSKAPGPLAGENRPRVMDPSIAGDSFVLWSSKIVDAVYQFRIPIGIAIATIFVVAASNSIYFGYEDGRNEDAAAQLYTIMADLPGQTDPLGQLGINLDDVARSDEELQQRAEQYTHAAEKLAALSKEYGDVSLGVIAQLKRASLLEKAGKPVEAAAVYQEAASSVEEPLFRYLALNGLAALEREQGNLDQGIQHYQLIVDELGGVWKQLGMVELARTFEFAKNEAKAIETYEAYLKAYPLSPQANDVEVRLATLKGADSANGSDE